MEDIVCCPVGLLINPGSYITIAHGKKKMSGNMRFNICIFINSFHGVLEITVRNSHINSFTNRIFVAKHFSATSSERTMLFGSLREVLRISIYKIVSENLEESGINIIAIGFIKLFCLSVFHAHILKASCRAKEILRAWLIVPLQEYLIVSLRLSVQTLLPTVFLLHLFFYRLVGDSVNAIGIFILMCHNQLH